MALHSLTLRTPVGDRPARLALPAGEGPHPAVVVIHDIFGHRPDTERHCTNFAAAGYAALAPDLYGGGRIGCVVRTLLDMVRETGPAFAVLGACRDLLAERDDVDGARIGITGFCMGGGFALLAGADDAYAVAAPFYGAVPRRAERLQGLCPTLAQFGEHDLAFRSHHRRLSAHLQALGVEHEVLVHEGAGHSFMNAHEFASFRAMGGLPPLYARHDPEVEAEAWARLLDFFARHMPAEAA